MGMESFKQRLSEYAVLTENTLQQYLPEETEDVVTEAMRYSLLAGGKRLRCALALEFCLALGGSKEDVLPFACALEMVHAYSLIHDDLPCMDDDDMRRGKPSCHIAFGEANALLAGDGLLTKAFEVMAQQSKILPERTVLAVGVLAQAIGHHGMIGGQRMDLQNEGKEVGIEVIWNASPICSAYFFASSVILLSAPAAIHPSCAAAMMSAPVFKRLVCSITSMPTSFPSF